MKTELNIEQMREGFDSWLRSQPHVLNVGFNQVAGKYLLHEDETAWQAWKASRAALVIELPGACECCHDQSAIDMHEACAQAIEAVGLKVNS